MPKFDVSDAAGFARLTSQSLTDLIQLGTIFGLADPRDWDIQEASYNDVLFHVFRKKVDYDAGLSDITDTGGRRKVKYQYPYTDGQTTDDLGRKPQTYQMNVLIHGPNYRAALGKLLAEFDKPQPGKLVHPIYGETTAAVEDFTIIHRSDTRKAAGLQVTFIEHAFTIGRIEQLQDSSVKRALAIALKVFSTFEAAMATIEAAQLLQRGAKIRYKELLEAHSRAAGSALTFMNQTFNYRGETADIPALTPLNLGGARNPDGTLATEQFITVRSVNDPYQPVPESLLSPTTRIALALPQIEKQVSALREQLRVIIQGIMDEGASLELFDTIVQLRETAILIQEVFETGAASSNARVVEYVTPREMSVREVAFENGVDVQRVQEIDVLNPELGSVNAIASGTSVRVPVT